MSRKAGVCVYVCWGRVGGQMGKVNVLLNESSFIDWDD